MVEGRRVRRAEEGDGTGRGVDDGITVLIKIFVYSMKAGKGRSLWDETK